ncbi:MAG: extracellular solute-binding protein [Sphaerochaeta sp.]|nr:extracellular solute-binding protein [Sphaerochaeta sp.]
MTKKLTLSVLLLCVSMMFAFAGGAQEVAKPLGAAVEPKVVRITGQSWMIQKILIEEAAERFMKDHPDVTVEISTYAEDSVISNYAIDWSRGKTPVDIAIVQGAQFAAQFVVKDLIYNFDNELNFFTGDFTRDKFVGVGLESSKIQGVPYEIPLITEAYALVINTRMFKEAGLVDAKGNPLVPKTWEEFYQFAKKLQKVQNGVVVQQGASLQWSVVNTYAMLLATLRAARGTVYGADGVSISFDNPEFREIMKIWKKGADEGVFSKEMYGDHFAGRNSLMANKLAMLIDSGSRWIEGASTLGKDNVTVIPFPGADTKGSYGWGTGIIIPKASPAPNLAVQFIKEQLLGQEVQTGTVNQYGKMPALLKYFEMAEDPEWTIMKTIADASGAPPTYKEFSKFQKATPPILQNYLDGKLTLDEAIMEFETLVKSLDKSTI